MQMLTHYLILDWISSQIHRYKLPLLPSLRVLRGKQIALFCSHFKWVRASVELDNSLQSMRCKHLINFIISTSIFLFISSMSSVALITWLVMVSHFESPFWMKYGPAQSRPPKQGPLQPHIKGFPEAKGANIRRNFNWGKAIHEMLFWLWKNKPGKKIYIWMAFRTLLLDLRQHFPWLASPDILDNALSYTHLQCSVVSHHELAWCIIDIYLLCLLRVCACSVSQLCLLFVIPWTVPLQSPLSMGFSRQEYWSVLPFPSPRDLPNPGIEPWVSCIGRRVLYHSATWEAPVSPMSVLFLSMWPTVEHFKTICWMLNARLPKANL